MDGGSAAEFGVPALDRTTSTTYHTDEPMVGVTRNVKFSVIPVMGTCVPISDSASKSGVGARATAPQYESFKI